MENYSSLLRDIMSTGTERPDRTGIGSKFINGATLHWELENGFPILTTRPMSMRIAFEETWMMLRGITDTTVLEDKKINIWKGNTTREFLDNRGLTDLPVGSLGTGYSHQWRNFGGTIGGLDGVDQIVNMLDGIKQDPTGRRHLFTGWNPTQLAGTPLPPCHLMNMYTVDPEANKLNSCFVMRSNDVPFGLPFNTMGYALLNIVFAKYLGYEPGQLTYFGWDSHIYTNQYDMVEEQLQRTPTALPKLVLNKELHTFEAILALEFSDFELIGYDPQPALQNRPKMAT